LSIVVIVALSILITFKFYTMIMKLDNKISSYTSAFEVGSTTGVDYNETKLLNYHVLRKQKAQDGPIYLNETTSSYIDIFFSKEIIDWTKPFNDRYTSIRVPARACRQADFGFGKQQKYYFEGWIGFSLVCPEDNSFLI
jgi:hypothetical protein